MPVLDMKSGKELILSFEKEIRETMCLLGDPDLAESGAMSAARQVHMMLTQKIEERGYNARVTIGYHTENGIVTEITVTINNRDVPDGADARAGRYVFRKKS